MFGRGQIRKSGKAMWLVKNSGLLQDFKRLVSQMTGGIIGAGKKVVGVSTWLFFPYSMLSYCIMSY